MLILGRRGTCFTGQPRSASESSAIVFSICCSSLRCGGKVGGAGEGLKVTFTFTVGGILPLRAASATWRRRAAKAAEELPAHLRYRASEQGRPPPHALDIFTKAHKRRPGIGFSTVYRGLDGYAKNSVWSPSCTCRVPTRRPTSRRDRSTPTFAAACAARSKTSRMRFRPARSKRSRCNTVSS